MWKRILFMLVAITALATCGLCQDVVHGHLIAPTIAFFNADASRAVTVGKADIVLWDVATGKPLQRIDMGNKISQYDPFNSALTLQAVASPDLSKVLVQLSTDSRLFGFLFDMNSGSLSGDDDYYNDKIYGFNSKNEYLVFRNLRTNNGPAGTRLEIGVSNAKTTMGVLSEFKPRGFSLDGKIVYGEDIKSGKLVIYNTESSKVTKTKLKFDGKNWYYITYPLLWTSKWTYVPTSYTEYFNIETGEVLKPFTDLAGPWTLSDDGNYVLYYRKDPWQFVLRDIKTNADYVVDWTSGMTAFMYYARIPADGSLRLHQLEIDKDKQLGRIVIYDMKNNREVNDFPVMADPQTISINKSLRQQMISGNSQASTTHSQPAQTSSGGNSSTAANRGYESWDGLLVNYQQLSLPWDLDYNTIQGRDVSEYRYKDKISYGHLEGSGLYAIGKVFDAEGHIGLLSMYRRVYGGADLSWFKMSIFDQQGNHIQTENIGNTQKDASGVSFRVDFQLTDAGDVITINISQKENNRTLRKTMTVDKYNGTIKTQ